MHIVDNILHFARARRGAVPLHLARTPLRPLLSEVVTSFAPLADAAGARLRLDVLGEPAALADAGALRQILLNLLDNAIKYGRPDQTIVVRTSEGAGRVRVSVDDEGTGIALNDRERIWMPYVRLTNANGSRRGGSGLGLAVVRELAEGQGGRVWVEESASGGSSFVVELEGARAALALDDDAHPAAVKAS
jgi:signal transduction histidine kinase